MDINNELIACGSCNKDISIMSDACPGCGAPNDWVHPVIKKFLDVKDEIETGRGFVFEYGKYEISGVTEAPYPWWTWFSIALMLVLVFGYKNYYGYIVAPIVWGDVMVTFWRAGEF